MIPDLPPTMDEVDVVHFYAKCLTALESRGYHHTQWFTHKGSGGSLCWICDLFLLARKLEGELEAVISKSALDFYDSPENVNNEVLKSNDKEEETVV